MHGRIAGTFGTSWEVHGIGYKLDTKQQTTEEKEKEKRKRKIKGEMEGEI